MPAELTRTYLTNAEPNERVILALDEMSWEQANEIMREVGIYTGIAKTNSRSKRKGLDFAIEQVRSHGLELMDDSKYKDTPRTMRDFTRESTEAGSRLITVHTSARAVDGEGLKYAVEGRDQAREKLKDRLGDKFDPFVGTLLGITVLTSETDESCEATYGAPVKEKVIDFAESAVRYGLDGIVCAVDDLEYLQDDEEIVRLLKVTPGIVLAGTEKPEGQQRVNTARAAILSGADYIVAGSVVTKPKNLTRIEAARLVLQDVTEGLAEAA